MRARVEAVTDSKNKTSKRIMLMGKWVGAHKLSGLKKGELLDVEIEETEKFGPWIQSFTRIPELSIGPDPAPVVSDFMKGAEPWWARFVSNCCGQAIQAGTIKDPTQIRLWAKHAFCAIRDCTDPFPSGQAENEIREEIEDDVPYWEEK